MAHLESSAASLRPVPWKSKIAGLRWAALAVVAVASCTLQAQTYNVLHNFTNGLDGADPLSGLTVDRAGNFYGVTFQGGRMDGACAASQGCGTVFRLTPHNGRWIFTPLYQFEGGEDGMSPYAAVTIGPDGALYGTTVYGGGYCPPSPGNGCGTVFRLAPPATACATAVCSWSETVIHRFSSDFSYEQAPYGGVVFDAAGNMYGTTSRGGAFICSCGVVYELSPNGSGWLYGEIHQFAGTGDGEIPLAGLTIDAAGNLYGTSSLDADGYGTAFEMVRSGQNFTFQRLHRFLESDGGSPRSGLVFDNSGNLYGVNNSVVYQLTPDGDSWTYSMLATNPNAFNNNVAIDADGNIYGTLALGGRYDEGQVYELLKAQNWTQISVHDFDESGGSDPFSSVILDAAGNLYGVASSGGTGGYGVAWQITLP